MAKSMPAVRKKQSDTETPAVCIQCIKTRWTKQSRGGHNAVLRNHVPEAMPLPIKGARPQGMTHYFHDVVFNESDNFAAPVKGMHEWRQTPPLDVGSLWLTLGDGVLHVSYQYDRDQGAPERHTARVPALLLCTGEWGRVMYNGRYSSAQWEWDLSDWFYVRRVYNIGLFVNPHPDVFLAAEPVKVFSQMAHLW